MNLADMIKGAIQVSRSGETEQAKVMMMGILTLTIDEMNKSLTRIEARLEKQELVLTDLLQSIIEVQETHRSPIPSEQDMTEEV